MTDLAKEVLLSMAQLQVAKIKDGADDVILDELNGYMTAVRNMAREKQELELVPDAYELYRDSFKRLSDEEAEETLEARFAEKERDFQSLVEEKRIADAEKRQAAEAHQPGQGFGALFPNPNGQLPKEGDA
jgi:hypothetical protein